MPFIENRFAITTNETGTKSDFAISNLNGDGNDVIVSSVNLAESSLVCAKTIYKTLQDAGYDATLDKSTCMITVFGFSFFVEAYIAPYTSGDTIGVRLYTYGYSEHFAYYAPLSAYGTLDELNFIMRLRGDSNGFILSMVEPRYIDSTSVPNYDYPLFTLFQCRNLVSGQRAWSFGESGISYSKTAEDIYTNIELNYNRLYITNKGCNTDSAYIYTPAIIYSGTIHIPSLILNNTKIFSAGNYYCIGDEIFWATGYVGGSGSISTTHMLCRID